MTETRKTKTVGNLQGKNTPGFSNKDIESREKKRKKNP